MSGYNSWETSLQVAQRRSPDSITYLSFLNANCIRVGRVTALI